MAIHLPVEILVTIVKEVDNIQDLRRLRVACRALCAVATPLAFPALSVITTISSAQNLGRLLDIPDIAAYVKEVSYNGKGADIDCSASPPYHQYHALSLTLVHLRWRVISVSTDAIDELARTFSRIHRLPELEAINLNFNTVYDNQTISDSEDRLSLQASILGAIATSFSVRAPSKLMSLSLLNLRTLDPHHPLETLPLQTILPNLRRLQLSAVSGSAPVPHTLRRHWRNFWSTLGPCVVPVQMQAVLTELTLHSDTFVGAPDGLPVRELHFPHLTVLSLRNIIFDPIREDEVFALRHAATLARLELLTCKVLIGPNRSPAPAQSKYTNLAGEVELGFRAHWDRIWDRFTAELNAVVTLSVDERHDDEEIRYVYRKIGGLYGMIHTLDSRNAADLAALQRFRMAVAARSIEQRLES